MVDAACSVERVVTLTSITDVPMIHNCAITSTGVMIFDLPVTLSPKAFLEGSSFPFRWNPKRAARVGFLPFDGEEKDVRWFSIDPCYVFHSCNSFDLDVRPAREVRARAFRGATGKVRGFRQNQRRPVAGPSRCIADAHASRAIAKNVTPYGVFDMRGFLQTRVAKCTASDAFWRDPKNPLFIGFFRMLARGEPESRGCHFCP